MRSPTLRQLAWSVAFNVNRTIGGGIAATELLRRSLADRGWLGAPDHGLAVAVSRLTPGTNILAYCAAIGWRFGRLPGGVTAVMAASVPSSLVILALTAALVRVDRYLAVQAMLAAGSIVAAGLVLSSAWYLVRPYLSRDLGRTAVLMATALILFVVGMTPIRALLATAALGCAWPTRQTS